MPFEGLALETMILAPAAVVGMAWWWGGSATSFPGPDVGTNLWLLGLGPVTTVALLLFAFGARRISMTTLGLMQYLAPTIQFVLGLWVFHEPFTPARLVGFGLIWAALALYTADSWEGDATPRRQPEDRLGSPRSPAPPR